MGKSRLKILLSGMFAGVPNHGGASWVVLQYLMGLLALGHEVHFVETFSDDAIRPPATSLGNSKNAVYFRHMISLFHLDQSATLVNTDNGETVGLPFNDLLRYAHQCDVLINLSGLLKCEELTGPIPIRAYIDIDPGFTQLWHVLDDLDLGLSGHNRYVTIGMKIGQADCPVPTGSINWIKSLQPVFLEQWPIACHVGHKALTTIANWRGYGSIEFNGRFFGQKAHSLRPFIELPKKTREKFILALAIHRDECSDLEQLNRFGWQLVDPADVADTPEAFRHFIQQSKAEFGVAKSGYVEANCGWFSDRSICYLASAKPVIAQDTGFSDFLPTGEGLFCFKNEDEILSSIESLNSDYARHCESARRLAETYFDSHKVLTRLLRNIGATV